MACSRERAEVLALGIVTWLVANKELLPVFQGATGVTTEDLRLGAGDPVFLASVLDFVMMDDAWVVEACDALSVGYDSLFQARQALPGGEIVNWT